MPPQGDSHRQHHCSAPSLTTTASLAKVAPNLPPPPTWGLGLWDLGAGALGGVGVGLVVGLGTHARPALLAYRRTCHVHVKDFQSFRYPQSRKWWCDGPGTSRAQGTWYGSGVPTPHKLHLWPWWAPKTGGGQTHPNLAVIGKRGWGGGLLFFGGWGGVARKGSRGGDCWGGGGVRGPTKGMEHPGMGGHLRTVGYAAQVA